MDTTLLPEQPESRRQLLKRSLVLYRRSFKQVLLLAFLLSIITFIPRLLSVLAGEEIFSTLHPLSPERIWLMLINFGCMILFVALLWRMNCVARNVHEPLAEDFQVGLKKFFYVFIATLIGYAILFAIGSIVFGLQIILFQYHVLFSSHPIGIFVTGFLFIGQCILILYILTLFYFLTPLIAIENNGIIHALERSVLLVWNHWWRVFSLQLIPWICYLILLIVLRFILHVDIHIYFLPAADHSFWITLLHIIIFMLFIPWVAALLLVQLRDLELRRELAKTHEERTLPPNTARV